jgi:hypothetical protein
MIICVPTLGGSSINRCGQLLIGSRGKRAGALGASEGSLVLLLT